jgi:hypothetical protein
MNRFRVLLFSLGMFIPVPAHAVPPSPINGLLFGFPGFSTAPGSARSASLAGSDRWLGDEPYDNPAGAGRRALTLTPVLQRVSRQDLRAENREYDETSGFLDILGGWASVMSGTWSVSIYLNEPLLRHEKFAYTRGVNSVQPATIVGRSSARELRGGLSVSRDFGALRFGLAGEWSRREDTYETTETSGAPESGFSHADFSGSGVGGQAGARWAGGLPWGEPLVVGVGLRFVPAMDFDGMQDLQLLVGDSTAAFSVKRGSAWEGGLSARIPAGPAFNVTASAGGRTAQDWDGFGVTDGAMATWRVGGEFHDVRDAWTLRFGIGQEQQTDVPESRAGVLGLGIGWDFEGTLLDFAVHRRTLERAGEPTSYEDRLVGSVIVEF